MSTKNPLLYHYNYSTNNYQSQFHKSLHLHINYDFCDGFETQTGIIN